jgi:predicted dehydrogenase
MITLALIGVGAWGKKYISTCGNLSDIKIKYICTKSNKTLTTLPDNFIKTTNYKDLFQYEDIDGVIVASPNATHHEISYEFLKRGFNVMVEKPMSENYRISKKLQNIQKRNGVKFQVGHVYLFDPAYIKAKELVQKIGKIRYIDFEGTSYGLLRKKSSALWDIGSHALSLCLDISKQKPKTISAWGNNLLYPKSNFYDFSALKIEFEDGSFAYIRVNWLFPEKRRKLIIAGEKDTILYDAEAEKKVTFYKDMIPNDDLYVRYNGAKVSYPTYDKTSPLENEIREFIKAIKENKQITYSGLEFGINVTKLLNLAERSIEKKGKPINF